MPDADVFIKTKHTLQTGQKLVLSGDIPELGCWQPEYAVEAVPLEPAGEGTFLVVIKLPLNTSVTWKWAVADYDDKIQKWEDHQNRQLQIDRKLILVYAPWNEETQVMDKSVKAYEFVPSYVLFDLNWQKNLPTRRMSQTPQTSTSLNNSAPDRSRIPVLNKEMKETRDKMIELQKKWLSGNRSQNMEDFMQQGLNQFKAEKATISAKKSPGRNSSPRRVQFKDRPNVSDESIVPSNPTKEHCNKQRNLKFTRNDQMDRAQSGHPVSVQRTTYRSERPKSAISRRHSACLGQPPTGMSTYSPGMSTNPPKTDVTTSGMYEGIEHPEGARKRGEHSSEEEAVKKEAKADKNVDNTDEVVIELSPLPTPEDTQKNLMWVTGAVGCVLLVFFGYYVYKRCKS